MECCFYFYFDNISKYSIDRSREEEKTKLRHGFPFFFSSKFDHNAKFIELTNVVLINRQETPLIDMKTTKILFIFQPIDYEYVENV